MPVKCCPPYIQPYSKTDTVVIPFGENMVEQYGAAPNLLSFIYFAPDGGYVEYVPDAKIVDDQIIITNPFTGTGYIKIS